MTEAAQKAVKETRKPETFAAKAYAAHSAAGPLAPFTLPRRSPRPQDVQIEILFCGVCHSDLHQVRNEFMCCRQCIPAYPATKSLDASSRLAVPAKLINMHIVEVPEFGRQAAECPNQC